ncbi:hypothetical protein ANN_05636, partial [Periplaneta americana]
VLSSNIGLFATSPKSKREDHTHKKNIIKNSIVKRLSYRNHAGNIVAEKKTGDDCRLEVDLSPVFNVTRSLLRGKETHYLDARLNIRTMYELYCSKHEGTKVKYDFYRQYFGDNFNYRFGRPQIDTCCMCEELNIKIRNPHLKDSAKLAAKAELEVHLRRSRKFDNTMKNMKTLCDENEEICALAFDFMQNAPHQTFRYKTFFIAANMAKCFQCT